MKVVILHDWLTGFRGGERVLEAICEMYPDAPIYTLIHKKGSTSPLIESKTILTSFLNKIPKIDSNYRKFLPLMPLAVSLMKIPSDVDLVISSSHCVIKGVKKPKNAKHICYIHSPMRYMYDQYDNYFRNAPLLIKVSAFFSRPFLQWWDKNSNKNVDYFIPNSCFVQKRIQRYYDAGSSVVNPFVDLDDFQSPEESKENFYLMVTAFAPNKRLDIAINAFNQLGDNYKLKIIGNASTKEIKHFKGLSRNRSIEFLGDLPRSEVVEYFKKAKGFIFPGVEDFGITPLESMAAGTPIIAYGKGGVLETITKETGVFFKSPNPESLIKAIKEFELKDFDKDQLQQRAKFFSKDLFMINFKKIVESQI